MTYELDGWGALGESDRLGALAPGEGAPALPAGLVAGWTFDNLSGGLVDFVGGRSLTPFENAPGLTSVPGVIGSACYADGTVGLVCNTLDGIAAKAGTIYELWIRPADVYGGYRFLVGQDMAAGENRVFSLYQHGDQLVPFLFNAYGGYEGAWSPNGVIASGAWHHVIAAISWDHRASLWINGGYISETPSVGAPLSTRTQPFTVFANISFYLPSPIAIDELRIFQKGDQPFDIAAFVLQRYNAGAGRRP